MYHQPVLNFKPEEVLDYLRKSRSDDPLLTVEEVLQKHESILDEWAEKHLGGKVPEENKFREVVSGETLKERPEIQQVLSLIESPKYKAVKVVEPQRLTRGDLEDIGRLMKLLKHTNTLVITPSRTYDLRDEYDWDAFERELKRGNDYLEYTKKILNRGKLLSLSQGNYISSKPPYGYEKIIIEDGKSKCPSLKIKEDEAAAVRIMFDLYVNQNMGRIRIANQLDEMGFKPPRGEHWSATGIKDMLSNIHYIGKVRWNWRKTITVVENGEFKKARPHTSVDEWLVFDGKHDPIISEELFYAAREKSGSNPRVKKNADLRNPFAGLLFCQTCGRALYWQGGTKNGKPLVPRYVCPNQKHCGISSCNAEDLIDRMCAVLKECIEDFEILIKNDDKDARKLHSDLIKQLEKKLADLNEKELTQWDKYSEEGMPKHIFDRLNEKVLKEKEEVQQALCKAKDSLPDPVDYEEKLRLFSDALAALKNPDVPMPATNALMKECIERIEYHREKPERQSFKKINGKFPAEGVWTNPPIELDVKLKV